MANALFHTNGYAFLHNIFCYMLCSTASIMNSLFRSSNLHHLSTFPLLLSKEIDWLTLYYIYSCFDMKSQTVLYFAVALVSVFLFTVGDCVSLRSEDQFKLSIDEPEEEPDVEDVEEVEPAEEGGPVIPKCCCATDPTKPVGFWRVGHYRIYARLTQRDAYTVSYTRPLLLGVTTYNNPTHILL